MLSPATEPNIDLAVFGILDRRVKSDAGRSILAGVSGIDGSGKGFIANQIVQRLLQQHLHASTPYTSPPREFTFVKIGLAKQPT